MVLHRSATTHTGPYIEWGVHLVSTALYNMVQQVFVSRDSVALHIVIAVVGIFARHACSDCDWVLAF